MTFTITFDHLPVPLNMNGRHHWGEKSDMVQVAQQEVALAVAGQKLPEGLEKVRLEFHFYLPDMRRRDLENLRASCKSYVDYLGPPQRFSQGIRPGLGILVGDHMAVVQEERQTWELRKDRPGFEISIVELE